MKPQSSFKELKKHGSARYSFEKYDIRSDYCQQFATNHWHDETEIVYVSTGSISITINHNTFIGKPGDIFIINSGEMHEIYGIATPLDYSAFVFDFDILSFRKEDHVQQQFLEPVLQGKLQFRNRVRNCEKLFPVLKYINERNTQKSDCYMLCTKAALLQVFAYLIEGDQVVIMQEPAIYDEKKQLLKDIVAYINDRYAEKIALEDIAGHFHMSNKYFCRFFKKSFNKTFVEYLNDVRIENAIYLLTERNLPVTEAAISCGFGNMSYFTQTFRRKKGCTPSQYKKQGGL